MTRQELSQLEIKVNVRVLWTIVAAVAIGAFVVGLTYSDMKGDIKNLAKDITELKGAVEKLREQK